MRTALSLLCCLFLAGCLTGVPQPEGFRMSQYKAPVPNRAPGATTLSTDEAFMLHQQGKALFIDVIGSGHYLTPGIEDEWLVVHARLSIPGSYWLPDVGRGALTAKQTTYLETALADMTRNRKDQALVFFCLKDCWMSWNATKRAHQLGYEKLYWYPQGSDGWSGAGHSLEEITPYNVR